MLNITVIHVGSFKEKYLEEAFSEYTKRISGYAKFEDITIKETFLPDNPSDTEIEKALSDEAQQILSLNSGSLRDILDMHGETLI